MPEVVLAGELWIQGPRVVYPGGVLGQTGAMADTSASTTKKDSDSTSSSSSDSVKLPIGYCSKGRPCAAPNLGQIALTTVSTNSHPGISGIGGAITNFLDSGASIYGPFEARFAKR